MLNKYSDSNWCGASKQNIYNYYSCIRTQLVSINYNYLCESRSVGVTPIIVEKLNYFIMYYCQQSYPKKIFATMGTFRGYVKFKQA